jgi:hypothetical protein
MSGYMEACLVCGEALEYLEQAAAVTCSLCGSAERGHVVCGRGHYVCEECHGRGFTAQLPALLNASDSLSPLEIAESLMAHPDLPMLGCEHAHVAAGALLRALINQGESGVTQAHLEEALRRTARQAVSAYCGLSGVCGVVPALGAAYSVLVGGQCGRGPETRSAMRLVSLLASATAEEAEPGCCKAYVRRGLKETVSYMEATLGLRLPLGTPPLCRDMDRHPHGCRGPACDYHPGARDDASTRAVVRPTSPTPIYKETAMTTGPAAQARYDDFFALAYSGGALDARTKILVSLGASLAAGCAP